LHEDVADEEDGQADLVLRADETEVDFEALETSGGVIVSAPVC